MSRPILAEYVRHGWVLVPIPAGSKGPTAPGWNDRDRCIVEPELAVELDGNVGLAHAYSGTCAIDIDDEEEVALWLAERGIDLYELMGAPDAVRIVSRPGRAKLLYAMPKPLPSFKVTTGEKRRKLELRCAAASGKTMQDVLPPSIHPDTRKPYEWAYGSPLGHWSNLAPLPESLANLWNGLITPRTTITVQAPSQTDSQLNAILAQHDPSCGYDDWIDVGMALHHDTKGAQRGFALWDSWSAKGSNYPGPEKLAIHWRSFRSDHPNPITLASLRVQSAASASEFEAVTTEVTTPVAAPAPASAITPLERAEQAVVADAEAREAASSALRELTRDANGRVLPWISNVTTVLSHPVLTGMQIAYDSFIDQLVCSRYGFDEWKGFTDNDYVRIRKWLETAGNFGPVGVETARSATNLAAEERIMDSAQIWLAGLQWDGIERLRSFAPRYLGSVDAAYERSTGVYMWTAMAGRVMNPGCQVDMVPIWVGEQGMGKSSGVKALVPSVEQYTTLRLDEPDEQAARKMRGVLVVELAELRGLNTVEIERIKEFITRTHERLVPKFKEHAVNIARRCIFIGTTNNYEALPRDGVNRRWLPLQTPKVDVAAIIRDRDQLWAEALVAWTTDGIAWRDAAGLAERARENHEHEDVWEDLISDYLAEHLGKSIRTRDILTQCIGLDVSQIRREHERRVSTLLTKRGYERRTARQKGQVVKVWVAPKLD